MKGKRRLFILFTFIFVIFCTSEKYPCHKKAYSYTIKQKTEAVVQRNKHTNPYDWVEGNKFIAHGLGGLEGNKRVTNSKEALENSYKNGYRIVEVDFVITTDGQLVARHDWKEYMFAFLGQHVSTDKLGKPLNLNEFRSLMIHKKYHPLTLEEIVRLMKIYPDLYLVTDTKSNSKDEVIKVFSNIVSTVSQIEPSVLERIIPQLYTIEMYDFINNIYPFKSYILTLYQGNITNDEAIEFVKDKGIKVVTMPVTLVNTEFITRLRQINVSVYVNTINDKSIYHHYQIMGVHGVYSDYLIPNEYRTDFLFPHEFKTKINP
ncbi:phosphatidylinositol-specific phospholipase C/glycerophosphodiester phosphodiesterase family protein [Gottfriedia sp. NPDC056225]|uniref:phosphatidylinositol-specific phospholipase C/glycerophosphodiester phosphodiesterase family protein n=1 Tax=Gottfriedia sp. NPDC056225 TaxID=3345751 RepID=UPI0035DA49B6